MIKLHFLLEDPALADPVNQGLATGFQTEVTTEMGQALQALRQTRAEFLFADLNLLKQSAQKSSFRAIFQTIGLVGANLHIIVTTWPGRLKEAIQAMDHGAAAYLTYPLVPDEVALLVEEIAKQTRTELERDYLRDQVWQEGEFGLLQTKSPAMKTVFEKIRAVAPTRSTVLLQGETGTGKGFTARLIHKLSARKKEQFIEVHCGAIPDTLVESEMFGHEKGAFTGAFKRKLGTFEIARQGTIFLDEIGTITPSAQIKLLQVLQDGVFHRVGGEEDLNADVRIIAATNIDLKQLCQDKLFRSDLYYRLNVFPIELPALKDRKEDIPDLVQIFVTKLNTFHMKGIQEIHPQVLEAFLSYAWPGNIRELENVLERAYILETTSVLSPENFPGELFHASPPMAITRMVPGLTLAQVRRREMDRVEASYLHHLLDRCKGRINAAAAAAGITPRQLHKLMTKHGLKKETYKSR